MMTKIKKTIVVLSVAMMTGFILNGITNADDSSDVEVTETGKKFFRDTSQPKLGKAWRDESGLVWGSIVMHEVRADNPFRNEVPWYKNVIFYMDHYEATNYCASIGGRLPTVEEFIRLREDMGAKAGTHEGYQPQILPGAYYGPWDTHWLWSSSDDPNKAHYAYRFDGESGRIKSAAKFSGAGDINNYYNTVVRCVVQRNAW